MIAAILLSLILFFYLSVCAGQSDWTATTQDMCHAWATGDRESLDPLVSTDLSCVPEEDIPLYEESTQDGHTVERIERCATPEICETSHSQ